MQQYRQASDHTAINLKTALLSSRLRELSSLTLPEIDEMIERVSTAVPAGNVPSIILNGLARLAGRKPPEKIVRRDVNLLFKGVEQVLGTAVYSALFAGPAAAIWAYQNLLRLVGKDPEAAFPEGTWQFYVDYALREDTARHGNETHGFDSLLAQHGVRLSQVDRITAWVMAVIHVLHDYPALLANEWRERVALALLAEITRGTAEEERGGQFYRQWEKQRPYRRGPESAPQQAFWAYRRAKFEQFLAEATQSLPAAQRRQWQDRLRAAERKELPAYQQQMSILATLEPDAYGETRRPIPLVQAQVGVIWHGRYHLIPVCTPGTDRPADAGTVRQQAAGLLAGLAGPVNSLAPLAAVKRGTLPALRERLNAGLGRSLDSLRKVPVLFNADKGSPDLPLSDLRQAERGIGDHPLTIFDTGKTFVFDQSHIFFDGAWGAAFSEILTNEALAWAVYLSTLPPLTATPARVFAPEFVFQPSDHDLIRQAPRVMPEVGVETDRVNLRALLALRELLKRRHDQLRLTVNDLLILYRAIHAATYRPAPDLVAELRRALPQSAGALDQWERGTGVQAAILIPVDASPRAPRDRLYPVTLEVPLEDLGLIELHGQVLSALMAFKKARRDQDDAYAAFDGLRRSYLATLAGFGAVMQRVKEIATTGESASVGAIKLLAYIPTPLQRLLDRIPGRIDALYDMIKGREVFSNVGAVAPGSTLTRFISAKDDNDKKTLVWGVITDAGGTMRISLRDFRPHVAALMQIGQRALAIRMAQDFLDAYAQGLNNYVSDLQQITIAGR